MEIHTGKGKVGEKAYFLAKKTATPLRVAVEKSL